MTLERQKKKKMRTFGEGDIGMGRAPRLGGKEMLRTGVAVHNFPWGKWTAKKG